MKIQTFISEIKRFCEFWPEWKLIQYVEHDENALGATANFSVEQSSTSEDKDIDVEEEDEEQPELEEFSDESLAPEPSSKTHLVLNIHITYFDVYSSPVIYFRAHTESGEFVELNQIHRLILSNPHVTSDKPSVLYNIITQGIHPYLRTPFYMIHPCQTTNILKLGQTLSQEQKETMKLDSIYNEDCSSSKLDSDDLMTKPSGFLFWISLFLPLLRVDVPLKVIQCFKHT
ncbi:putative Autophagocytosis associated protein, active-site domain [Monocercomonoides exilis]|uniref:putative Autophagocytosis associated protein, active-site domain n=1 Tax=Monocercomonoides exilis TaxID=2049356 RepID=UPI00355A7915|nr:putative Autophagocytosis associated protein, active-site domain [Monocercomonoides exilis]